MSDAEHRSGQPLRSLLIKPVQRLCKYPLFFRELIKSLPEADAAQPALRHATATIEAVVLAVNEIVRNVDGTTAFRQTSEAVHQPDTNLASPRRTVLLSVKV